MVLFCLIILAFAFLAEVVLTEVEHFGWATLTLLAAGVVVQFAHLFDILQYVKQNAVHAFVYALLYLLAGFVWSFIKWFSYLMNQRELFRSLKKEFLEYKRASMPDTYGNYNGDQIPSDLKDEFKSWTWQNRKVPHDSPITRMEKPRANKNKSRIIGWMSFWPFSMLGTLINDPIRRLFTFMFNAFKAAYQKMADSIFSKDVELR